MGCVSGGIDKTDNPFLNRIAMFHFDEINSDIAAYFKFTEFEIILSRTPIEKVYPYFMMIVFFLLATILILGSRNAYEKVDLFKPTIWNAFTIAVLLFWCIVSFGGVSTFLYFNF